MEVHVITLHREHVSSFVGNRWSVRSSTHFSRASWEAFGRGGLRCAAVTLYPDITNAIPATSAGGFKHGDGQEKTDSHEKFIEVSA